MRYVRGLRAEAGRAIEAERRRAPLSDLADLAKRVPLHRDELDALAESGALATLGGGERRSVLWQVAAVERDRGSLFAGVVPAASESPLPEMSPLEVTLADYRASGLTTGPQLMTHLRPELRRRGLLAARELRGMPNGRFVRTAGHVIVRQRPGSAKGFCFLTLEDETGTTNAILTPRQFQRFRAPLHVSPVLEIGGPLQSEDGVLHVRVRDLQPLRIEQPLPRSHDYR